MRVAVDANWTILEAYEAARQEYRSDGLVSRGARNNVLRAWAAAVGRTRALRDLDEYVEQLDLSDSTYRNLRRQFNSLWEAPQGEGLILYFRARLAPCDRYLIDGVIFGVLGKNTDCRMVEFREQGDAVVIRLQAGRRHDLELVAEALYRRIWEQQEHVQEQALRLASAVQAGQAVINQAYPFGGTRR